ncbi:MAG TPA: hypothetical protein VGF22_03130 [Acidimicrobiales bacterium]|jgi:hypothetical protein
MTSRPDRGTVVTAELATESEELRARRSEVAVGAGLRRATAAALEADRAALRRGRTGLDTTTIERLRRPS